MKAFYRVIQAILTICIVTNLEKCYLTNIICIQRIGENVFFKFRSPVEKYIEGGGSLFLDIFKPNISKVLPHFKEL